MFWRSTTVGIVSSNSGSISRPESLMGLFQMESLKLHPMPKILLLFTAFIALNSCHKRTIPQKGNYPPPMIAISDDTFLNFAIDIVANHRFAFTISYGSERPYAKHDFYSGTWEYQNDTLFLHFKEKRPPGVANYLLKEITGNWWVQIFTDGRPRVFLRIQRPIFR